MTSVALKGVCLWTRGTLSNGQGGNCGCGSKSKPQKAGAWPLLSAGVEDFPRGAAQLRNIVPLRARGHRRRCHTGWAWFMPRALQEVGSRSGKPAGGERFGGGGQRLGAWGQEGYAKGRVHGRQGAYSHAGILGCQRYGGGREAPGDGSVVLPLARVRGRASYRDQRGVAQTTQWKGPKKGGNA